MADMFRSSFWSVLRTSGSGRKLRLCCGFVRQTVPDKSIEKTLEGAIEQ